MNKKLTIPIVIILLLVAGGIFWWQGQADVRELNKNLPEGVRIAKSLIGKEYKVVNKIDGYEVKLPKGWKGVDEIEYSTSEKEGKLKSFLLLTASKEGEGFVGVDLNKTVPVEKSLETWVQEWIEEQEPFLTKQIEKEIVKIEKEKLGELEVVELKEMKLGSIFSYFFQINSKIYRLWGGASDKSVREIILKSKW